MDPGIRDHVAVVTGGGRGMGGSMQANCSAAKAGLIGMTRAMALDPGRYDITGGRNSSN